MKSLSAQVFIEFRIKKSQISKLYGKVKPGSPVIFHEEHVVHAVELAEKEMREKAIEAHCRFCPYYQNVPNTIYCFKGYTYAKKNTDCIFMKHFIKMLDN